MSTYSWNVAFRNTSDGPNAALQGPGPHGNQPHLQTPALGEEASTELCVRDVHDLDPEARYRPLSGILSLVPVNYSLMGLNQQQDVNVAMSSAVVCLRKIAERVPLTPNTDTVQTTSGDVSVFVKKLGNSRFLKFKGSSKNKESRVIPHETLQQSILATALNGFEVRLQQLPEWLHFDMRSMIRPRADSGCQVPNGMTTIFLLTVVAHQGHQHRGIQNHSSDYGVWGQS